MAIEADAKDLKLMTHGIKLIFRNNLLLQPLQLRAVKFDRSVTTNTNNMMVVGPVIDVFKSCPSVLKIHLTGEAAIGKRLECPKNCRVTYSLILLSDKLIEFFCA